MHLSLKAGATTAALFAAAVAGPVLAADLGGRGSLKDTYVVPMPQVVRGPAGPCYVRADVGYSHSSSPTVTWPVSREVYTYSSPGVQTDYQRTFLTDKVTDVEIEDTWFGEAGFGCGSGSRGFRAEAVFGLHGDRKVDGVPGNYSRIDIVGGVSSETPIDDPLHTSLRTYTGMVNVFKDLGNWGGLVPYVGAGVGFAYHKLDDVYFTGNPQLTNRIKGTGDMTFAWALMAGVGYQVSDRAILDFGYRYIDLGKAESERIDSGGFANPRVKLDDITAHEFKVGLRYHFGSECCGTPAAVLPPLK